MMEQQQRLHAVRYRLAHYYLDKLRMAQRIYLLGNENEAAALSMFDQDREQVRQLQAWLSTNDSQDEQVTALCSEYASAGPDI
jgi:hypothetical protein